MQSNHTRAIIIHTRAIKNAAPSAATPESGNKNLDQLINCWTTVLLQFIEDFRISTPEIDQMVEELKQKEPHS